MKKTLSIFFAMALFAINAHAQFTNKLESACVIGSTLQGNGIITFPASDFAICAFTTQIEVGGKWVDIKVNDKTPQNGKYSFSYTIPAGISVGYPCKVRTVTNRQTASELVMNNPCGAIRFKNRYTANQWINIEKGAATADAVQPAFLSAQWKIVPVAGTKFVRLESVWKPGNFLNIEKGVVEATAIQGAAWSAHWELEEVQETRAAGAPVYYRLKNRWKADLKQPVEYLNTEKGKLECTAVSLSFQSANWLVERTW